MEDNVTFSKKSPHRTHTHYSPNLLSTIDNAIEHHKVVTIEYDSFEKGITKRDVEPVALVFKDRRRHLVGWCRLRNAFRSFRLDRLNCIKIRNEEFTVRPDFNIDEFRDNSMDGPYEKEFDESN